MAEKDGWSRIKGSQAYTEKGVAYLCGTIGSIILACDKCGEEHFREPWHYFIHPPEWEKCWNCRKVMEPIRIDELETRWKPFWLSLGHTVRDAFIEEQVVAL